MSESKAVDAILRKAGVAEAPRGPVLASKRPRGIPVSEASEIVTIGTVIRDDWRNELDLLNPGDYVVDSHRRIFAALREMHRRGKSIDFATLQDHMGRQEVAECGGAAYIASLTEGLPYNCKLEDHVKIIKGHTARRKLLAICSAVEARVDSGESPAEIGEWFKDQLDSLDAAPSAGLNLLHGPGIEERDTPVILPGYFPDLTAWGVHGRAGDGKTSFLVLIAADLSRGRTPFTGTPCASRNILILTNEDSPSRIRRMLATADGDLERLWVENTDDLWQLSNLSELEKAIREHSIGFVVIDSLASHRGGADLNSHAETMSLLIPLRALAEKHLCSIAVIHHLNKSLSADHIQKVSGSIGITAALRHNVHVVPDPENADLRLCVNGKSNLFPPNAEALSFSLMPLRWFGTSRITLDEVYSQQIDDTKSRERPAQARATEWLAGILAQGSREQSEVMQLAKGEGISEATLRRAKTALKVCSRKASYGSGWYWWLNTEESHS